MFWIALIVIACLVVVLLQLLMNYQTRGQGMRVKKDPLQHRIELHSRILEETVDKVRDTERPKLLELEERVDEYTELHNKGGSLVDELVKEGLDAGILVAEEEGDEEEFVKGVDTTAVEDAIALAFDSPEEPNVDCPVLVSESRTSLEELKERLTEMDRDAEIMAEALNRLEALADERQKTEPPE